MQTPSLAIVVPVRNRASVVEQTLDSIAAQDYRPLRIILVDNGSADGTAAVLERWADAHRAPDLAIDLASEPRPGACAARNAGLALVQEPWTMFFDSDDIMLPGHLSRAMACVAQNPKAQIVGWDITLTAPGRKPLLKRFPRHDMHYQGIIHGCMSTEMYMARTECFRAAGAWNADLPVWNDIELSARLLALEGGAPTVFLVTGKPLVEAHVSTDSITGSDYSSRGAERERSIDCIEAVLPKPMRWIANLKRAVLAGCYCREGRPEMGAALMERLAPDSAFRRLLYKYAFWHTRRGLPGAARLLRPLF